MDKNIFTGTVLAEVLDFKGDLKEVGPSTSILFEEKEIGTMTKLERILNTLAERKHEEGRNLVTSICGQDVAALKDDDERKLYAELVKEKATEDQLEKIRILKREATFVREAMWDLIRMRIPEASEFPTVGVRPEWKIVAGISKQALIGEMFGGMSMGIGILIDSDSDD